MALLGSIHEDENVYIVHEAIPFCGNISKIDAANLQSWIPEGCKHTILAADCDYSKVQALKNIPNLISPKEEANGLTKDYLMKRVVPKIINEFFKLGLVEGDKLDELKASLVIASNDKVFFLGSKGTIREISTIEFFSYGSQFMLAAMDNLKDLPLVDRILISSLQFDEKYYTVHFPIIIRDVKTLQVVTYTRDDCIKAYNDYLTKEDK